MTMRKPNYAQQMAELRNEIDTVEKFMVPMVREAEELDATAKTRLLSTKERERVSELTEIIHEKNVFLVKARRTLEGFYKPVAC